MVGEGFLGKTVRVIDRLLPQTEAGRKITRQMFLPAIFVYVARFLIASYIENERDFSWIDSYVFPLLICVVYWCSVVFLFIFLTWLALRTTEHAQHKAPAVVLISGLAIVLFLPLPQPPRFPYAEETFFITHRTEFEQVVELAYEDGLACSPDVGCDALARKLPAKYKALSVDDYVWVAHAGRGQAGLTLTFWPMNQSYPVVYFEKVEDRKLSWFSECWDGRWVRKLAEHWYVCIEDD